MGIFFNRNNNDKKNNIISLKGVKNAVSKIPHPRINIRNTTIGRVTTRVINTGKKAVKRVGKFVSGLKNRAVNSRVGSTVRTNAKRARSFYSAGIRAISKRVGLSNRSSSNRSNNSQQNKSWASRTRARVTASARSGAGRLIAHGSKALKRFGGFVTGALSSSGLLLTASAADTSSAESGRALLIGSTNIPKEDFGKYLTKIMTDNALNGPENRLYSNRYIPVIGVRYNLSEPQIQGIARLCQQEQGNPRAAAIEAELMSNRFELYGKEYGTGGDGLYNYVKNSEWWSKAPKHMAATDSLDPEVLKAVRNVLVNGDRTIPTYIDEHDCYYYKDKKSGRKIYDINTIATNGNVIQAPNTDIENRKNYVQDETRVYNRYGDGLGSTDYYTYYDTPTGDPFGYTDNAYRSVTGETPPNYSDSSGNQNNE